MTSRGASIESLPETTSNKTLASLRKSSRRGVAPEGQLFSILVRLGGERGIQRVQMCRQFDTFAPSRAGNGGRLEPQRAFSVIMGRASVVRRRRSGVI